MNKVKLVIQGIAVGALVGLYFSNSSPIHAQTCSGSASFSYRTYTCGSTSTGGARCNPTTWNASESCGFLPPNNQCVHTFIYDQYCVVATDSSGNQYCDIAPLPLASGESSSGCTYSGPTPTPGGGGGGVNPEAAWMTFYVVRDFVTPGVWSTSRHDWAQGWERCNGYYNLNCDDDYYADDHGNHLTPGSVIIRAMGSNYTHPSACWRGSRHREDCDGDSTQISDDAGPQTIVSGDIKDSIQEWSITLPSGWEVFWMQSKYGNGGWSTMNGCVGWQSGLTWSYRCSIGNRDTRFRILVRPAPTPTPTPMTPPTSVIRETTEQNYSMQRGRDYSYTAISQNNPTNTSTYSAPIWDRGNWTPFSTANTGTTTGTFTCPQISDYYLMTNAQNAVGTCTGNPWCSDYPPTGFSGDTGNCGPGMTDCTVNSNFSRTGYESANDVLQVKCNCRSFEDLTIVEKDDNLDLINGEDGCSEGDWGAPRNQDCITNQQTVALKVPAVGRPINGQAVTRITVKNFPDTQYCDTADFTGGTTYNVGDLLWPDASTNYLIDNWPLIDNASGNKKVCVQLESAVPGDIFRCGGMIQRDVLPLTARVYQVDGAGVCTGNSSPVGFTGEFEIDDADPSSLVFTANVAAPLWQYQANLAPGQAYNITLNVTSPSWILASSCPSATQQVILNGVRDGNEVLPPPNDAVVFYVQSLAGSAWWQTQGGDVAANDYLNTGGTVVRSYLPAGEYLSLAETAPFSAVSGILSYFNGTVELPTSGVANFAQAPKNWMAQSRYDVSANRKESYSYFATLMEATSKTDPWSLDHTQMRYSAIGSEPAGEYVYYVPVSGTLTWLPGNVWQIPNDKQVTIFIGGDLNINTNVTVADDGGFLAFIVSGQITVAPTVTQLQGIYIADRVIETGTQTPVNDNRLEAEGMFIGWGGVTLSRNLGAVSNLTLPAETFKYRPDFLLNAPDKFRKARYEWSEVAP